ncbi:capsule biosynthesis protein [Marinithermofilum abyssi]|uniref:Capsule biosynthesis protein n=1 Tax=Marinithermofilum abyssi TaxID=1571185 RepID=A0A8J2YC66_9BACL|nr:capsule biosynthesis protein [Marinithermofilum abyssi]
MQAMESEPAQLSSGNRIQQQQKAPAPIRLRIAAVGDIMMHDRQIRAGDGVHRYDAFFRHIRPYLEQADLTLGNLETTLAPAPPYTGYPKFRSPAAYADALKHAGFDLLSTANNHAMDGGISGVRHTWQELSRRGIHPVGTAPKRQQQTPVIVDKSGIRFSFSAYTYGTNGIPVPGNKKYLVNRIDFNHIQRDIRESKRKGADFIVVQFHFGKEYARTPSQEQKDIANKTLKAGADVVLGSHPHVLQPLQTINHNGKTKLIAYSLGNFISDQQKPYTNDGAVLYLDIVKKGKETRLNGVSFLPTFTYKYLKAGNKQFSILPLQGSKETIEARLPSRHGINKAAMDRSRGNTLEVLNRYQEVPIFQEK